MRKKPKSKNKFKFSSEIDRCRVAKRIIGMMIDISERPMTLRMLTEKYGVCMKTTRRMIRAIEDLGVPVQETLVENDGAREVGAPSRAFHVERAWMKRFL